MLIKHRGKITILKKGKLVRQKSKEYAYEAYNCKFLKIFVILQCGLCGLCVFNVD